jgi:GT2 family glycosyltransferase
MQKVTVLTVTYGDRWKYLSQVVESVIHDLHLERFIIVDNGLHDRHELDKLKELHGEKIDIIGTGKNIGSAGGFALGLEHARTVACDFVLMLDDDNVPEPNALRIYVDNYASIAGRHMILGFRPDIQDESIFRSPPEHEHLKYTFFDVWSWEKLEKFLKRLFGNKASLGERSYHHVVRTKGFVYGGAFLPIEAVKDCPLPDKDLVLYGDDVEYSWGVLDHGYHSYLCDRPIIRDVDMSFEQGDHILGLFNPSTKPFKVYYRIRNMVRISLRNSSQSAFALHSSVIIWTTGLILLGLFKSGPVPTTLSRIKLIIQAVYGGYAKSARVPSIAKLP